MDRKNNFNIKFNIDIKYKAKTHSVIEFFILSFEGRTEIST